MVPESQVPSLNVTLPAVTGASGLPKVTVAVRVTDCPGRAGFWDELTTVVVGAAVTVNVCEAFWLPDAHWGRPPGAGSVLALWHRSTVQVPTTPGVNVSSKVPLVAPLGNDGP